jgi:hypothetical protein
LLTLALREASEIENGRREIDVLTINRGKPYAMLMDNRSRRFAAILEPRRAAGEQLPSRNRT